MSRWLLACALAACTKSEPAPPLPDPTPVRQPSGGGFSADLAKELTDDSPTGPRTNAAGTEGAKQQAPTAPTPGSAAAPAPGAPTPGSPPAAAPGAPTPGSAAAAAPGAPTPGSAAAAAPGAPTPGSASAPTPGSASAPTPGSAAAPASAPTPGSASAPTPGSASAPTPGSANAPLSAELAAIKIDLMPNWVRDVVEPATVSLAVTQQSTGVSQTFVFHYGYESAAAPSEREAYKKWLADSKTLVVQQDRQAGAAWFLQGTDARGGAAFRVVVNFGGRKLVCHGSLYKDAASDKLGDIRDEVILQAKKICESIAL